MDRKNKIIVALVFLLIGSLVWHYNTTQSYHEQHNKNIHELSTAVDTLVKVIEYEGNLTGKYYSLLVDLREVEVAMDYEYKEEYDFKLESDSIEIELEMHTENLNRLISLTEQINKVVQDLGSHLKD